MTAPPLDRVLYDEAARRWRRPGGSFVSADSVRAELTRHAEAAQQELADLTRRLYAGELNTAQWELAVSDVLKDGHLAQAAFGGGGRANLGAVEFGRVGGNLGDEYRHLHNFAEQIARGEVSEATALSRINQYGNAVEQAYWREWGRAQDRPEWRGLPVLNQVPRDGRTQCHGNCGCYLDPREDGLYWVLGVENNCPDCPPLAAGSPYRPGNL